MHAMFQRFFPESTRADEFAEGLRGAPLSMADLQGFFMFFKHDEAGVFANLADYAEGARSAMQGRPPDAEAKEDAAPDAEAKADGTPDAEAKAGAPEASQ